MSTNPTKFDLRTIKGVIADMDGVIWLGTEILPGVPDLFLFLRDHDIPYTMATNNSTRTRAEYVARLTSLNIPISEEDVVTSSLVTAETLTRKYPSGTPIYVIGGESLSRQLTDYGFTIDPFNAQIVIVGLDVTLTYEKLTIAGQRILAGAEFIGTNADASLPTNVGITPGAGSILAALSTMTGQKPRLMGKPETAMFNIAVKRLGTASANTLMIGDRIDTDIEGAQKAGLKTVLLLSGVTDPPDAQTAITAGIVDGLYENLSTLLADWRVALS